MKAEGENNMSQQLTNKQQARRTEVHVCMYVCMYVCITTTLNKQQTLFSVW